MPIKVLTKETFQPVEVFIMVYLTHTDNAGKQDLKCSRD